MNFLEFNGNNLKDAFHNKNFSFLSLIVCMFLLPLSINLSSFFLFLGIGLKLVQLLFFKQKLFKVKSLRRSSYIGLFLFIYIILNSAAQSNLSYTTSVFEREFSHLTLFFLTPMLLSSKADNMTLIISFFIGLAIACLYVFIMTFILQISFDRNAFEGILDIHHTYLAMYLLFFINFLLVEYFANSQDTTYKKNIIYGSIITITFSIIFILNSKVSIVIFAVILIGYLITYFSRKYALRYILIFSVLIMGVFLFNKKLSINYKRALDFRLEIWQESLNIIKGSPFVGNLKMKENDILNLMHYLNGKYYLMDSNLNSHNQYLSILLKYGIIGLLIIMIFITNAINTLNKSTSKRYIKETVGVGVIVLITFYIENVLDRHHGIVFCTVFYNYYLVAIQNENI